MNDVASLNVHIRSEQVETAETRLTRFTRAGTNAERAANGLTGATRRSLAAFTAFAASTFSVSAAAGAATARWLSYNTAMKEVASITSDSSAEMASLRTDVLALATAMGVDATVAAKGLYQAISAGVPRDNALDFMRVASKAAIAGVTDVNVAVDGLTNAINAFKIPVEDATTVSDKLFAAVVDGKTTFAELSAHMSKASVPAAALGVDLDELLASIISITKQGTPTSEAFTQVKAALNALMNPSEEMAQALKNMGFESARAAVAQQGLGQTLEQITQQFAGNDQGLVKALRSTEAYNGVLSVTGVNLTTFEKGLRNVKESAGNTARAFDENAGTLENSITSLRNSFVLLVETFESSVGAIELVGKLLKDVADGIVAVNNSGGVRTAIASAQRVGGAAGASVLQQQLAELEAQRDAMEANGASLDRLRAARQEPGFGARRWLSNEIAFDVKLEDVTKEINETRAALEGMGEDAVQTASLMQQLEDATTRGDEAAIAGAQERLALLESERVEREEMSRVEALFNEAGKQLQQKKTEEAAKQLEIEAKKNAYLDEAEKTAAQITTTERDRLELQIAQLEELRKQRPEQADLAAEGIAMLREEIALLDERNAARSGGGGSAGGGGGSVKAKDSLLQQLYGEEQMLADSYDKRRVQILEDTQRTAIDEYEIRSRYQQLASERMQARVIGNHQFELNAYSDFFGNLAALSSSGSEKAFRLAQAASIAQATVKMYESAVSAYAQGTAINPYLGPVFAAAALAAGAANIAAIKGQQFQAYETGGMIGAGNYGIVGEAGPELVRGPAVVTSARATKNATSNGGPEWRVIINNTAPGYAATATVDNTTQTVEIAVKKTLTQLEREVEAGGGRIFPTFARKHGLRRQGGN